MIAFQAGNYMVPKLLDGWLLLAEEAVHGRIEERLELGRLLPPDPRTATTHVRSLKHPFELPDSGRLFILHNAQAIELN